VIASWGGNRDTRIGTGALMLMSLSPGGMPSNGKR
jgi:hypothetical protein